MPVENACPKEDGSRINLIKTNKRSTLKSESDAFNTLIMISINGAETRSASYLIKQTS